jgi:FkbM family methyltransferase
MGLAGLIAALPKDFVLTLVDVGSAGGLHPRWQRFRPIMSAILFDPREAEASGGFGPGQTRVYPVALSDQAGEAALHITALPNMSSFLLPDAEVFGRYRKKGRDAAVTSTETVPVDRLDNLAQADGFKPNVLKIDTQGSELLVLKGAEESLKSVLLAEVEVSFFQRYAGQPLFADIQAWMTDRGFELIELHRLKRYRAQNSLGIYQPLLGSGQRSGRVTYGDAIFIRTDDAILDAAAQDHGTSLLRAVVALLAYGKADHAAALLDKGRDTLPQGRAAAVSDALTRLNRRRFIPLLTGLSKQLRS